MKKILVCALVMCVLLCSVAVVMAETYVAGIDFGTDPSGSIYIDGDPAKGADGLEYEFLKEVLQCCEVDMEYQDVSWDALFTGLLSEKWDVAACQIFVTQERMKSMAFSDPYLSQDICLMVPADKPINTFEEMKGKIICADSGAGGEEWLLEHQDEYGPYTIQTYSGTDSIWLDVLAGRCDAGIGDSFEIENYVSNYPEVTTGVYMNMGYECAYAFRPNDPILPKFNECQRQLKESGRLEELYIQYVGNKPNAESSVYKLYDDAPYVPVN